MNLASLKPGESGRITRVGAVGPLKRRLMEMGVLAGEAVRVEKIAPLGDPIEVTIKNYKELGIPVVVVLNIYDEAKEKGYRIDIPAIEKALGVRVVPTVATRKEGLSGLLEAVTEVAGNPSAALPRPLNYGEDLEAAAAKVLSAVAGRKREGRRQTSPIPSAAPSRRSRTPTRRRMTPRIIFVRRRDPRNAPKNAASNPADTSQKSGTGPPA